MEYDLRKRAEIVKLAQEVSKSLKAQPLIDYFEQRPETGQVDAIVGRLTIHEKQKVAEIATEKRDEELRELKTTKGSFSAADVRIVLEAVAELNA